MRGERISKNRPRPQADHYRSLSARRGNYRPMGSRSRPFDSFRRRTLQMNHPDSKQRERGGLLDALSRIVKARRRSTRRDFVYCRIQPTTMTPEKKIGICDPCDVTLQENTEIETQVIRVRRYIYIYICTRLLTSRSFHSDLVFIQFERLMDLFARMGNFLSFGECKELNFHLICV